MRTQTPKQAAAFKEKVTKALIALGATADEAYYGYQLNTVYGRLRLSPGENSIRTRFDVVPKVHCLSGASLNPWSGKWNHEFNIKPTQEQLDYAIKNIKAILCT